MIYKFEIKGRLSSMNDYTEESRKNKYAGAELKRSDQHLCEIAIMHQLRGVRIKNPVHVRFCYYEKNKRRDLDNIAGFAHKVIFDALVSCGVLKDDGWDEVIGFYDEFHVSKHNPRIEVFLDEQRQILP